MIQDAQFRYNTATLVSVPAKADMVQDS